MLGAVFKVQFLLDYLFRLPWNTGGEFILPPPLAEAIVIKNALARRAFVGGDAA
jgi:hypothetical protein